MDRIDEQFLLFLLIFGCLFTGIVIGSTLLGSHITKTILHLGVVNGNTMDCYNVTDIVANDSAYTTLTAINCTDIYKIG